MELVNVNYTGTGGTTQDLSAKDSSLVSSNFIFSQFGRPTDVIELHIYGESGELLLSDYNATDYYPYLTTNPGNGLYSSLTLDPVKDVKNRGYSRGSLSTRYNFLSNLFNSSEASKYWIKEISRSRTEIKLASQTIPDSVIRSGFNQFDAINRTKNYYVLFYLNFGNNQLVVANNAAYTEDEEGSYLLIKLYEPLPSQYELKDQLWIAEKVAESANFQISIEIQLEEVVDVNALRGPNYNVLVNNKSGQTTPYYTYNDLFVSPITSSFQKLKSFYQDKAVSINVDYSNFSNFVKFSSATERINNFVYKLGLIETSKANIAELASIVAGPYSSTVTVSSSIAEQRIIDNIIGNFDTYEYFLYFDSSSWAWPKRTSTQPYELYSITSSQALNFLGSETTVPTATTASLLFSASYYDSTNKDILRNTAPQYLLDDPSNQPFVTFLDMIGQHFDNLWIYYRDVTNRFNATNNPNTGISLDLVSDALKGLGFQLFTNTNVSDNLYYTLFGINADGSLLPPTGSELITRYVTSSIATLPAEQIQDEIYKRLYHNIPYLYKTKGTAQSIKSLISIFGIPDSFLTVREFGGNQISALDGILDLNSSNYKVNISTGSAGSVTGSLTISSSVLSPYTTIQYYEGNTRLNNTNLEIGFSPSDKINDNITGSLSTFDIDQLIGSPAYRYSSSYTPLVSASNSYFSSYTQPNSIWEYIRLLKFYNNSLFKIIKDFVPARSNVSTGIIIKSHMLERNKYARHEPTITFNDYSQSIDILEVSADNGGAVTGSTSWSGMVVTPLGLASYSSSKNQELYTGEYSGSNITVTDGSAMEQGDYISHTTGAIDFYNYGALHQNISGSVRSNMFLDLDYNSNQLKPVNYGIVTYSLNILSTNAYSAYINNSNPFAQVQDYNYFLQRSVIPRYAGSETISSKYNTYTLGDSSYGKTAAIDKIKRQYAYLVDIYSSSFQMPNRAQAQIKYLIDNDQNVINLSKTNTNIFEVQNNFKSGESADVSLFDYDSTNPYVQKLNNEQEDFTIWESGYSYSPLIYNPSGALTYTLGTPFEVAGTPGTPSTVQTLTSSSFDYWTTFQTKVWSPYSFVYILDVTASAIVGPPTTATSTAAVTITYFISNPSRTPNRWPSSGNATVIIPAGKSTSNPFRTSLTNLSSEYSTWNGDTPSFVVVSQTTGSAGTPSTPSTFTTSSLERDTRWFLLNENTVKISYSQSFFYRDFVSSGSYSGLDGFVFPFEASKYDLIRFYNSGSKRWDSSGEFRISNIDTEYSDESGSFIVFNLNRSVDTVFTDNPNATSYPVPISRYLLLKRLQDETSIYFNYDLPEAIPQDGTLFPQYIGQETKENSGNVIKALKQQNLI